MELNLVIGFRPLLCSFPKARINIQGVQNNSYSNFFGLRNRVSAILQPIRMKLDTMTDRAGRILQPHLHNDDVTIEDVTIGFVIMKISTVRH